MKSAPENFIAPRGFLQPVFGEPVLVQKSEHPPVDLFVKQEILQVGSLQFQIISLRIFFQQAEKIPRQSSVGREAVQGFAVNAEEKLGIKTLEIGIADVEKVIEKLADVLLTKGLGQLEAQILKLQFFLFVQVKPGQFVKKEESENFLAVCR